MFAFLVFFFIIVPFLICAIIVSPAFGFALGVMAFLYWCLYRLATMNRRQGK